MFSRVAENIYWMARCIERAENTARLVSVNANLLLDLPRGVQLDWEPLITIVGMNQPFQERYSEASERNVMRFLIGDQNNPNSILSSLRNARENCRTVRDIVPRSGWERLNELFLYAKDNVNSGLTKGGRYAYLTRIITGSQGISGLLSGTMARDEAYQFLRIGRNLERADMTTRIIDVRSTDLLPEETPESKAFDTIQWISVLNSLSAYQAYRRLVQVQVSRAEVLIFLFQNRLFPRAFNHCIDTVKDGLQPLKNSQQGVKVLADLKELVEATPVNTLRQTPLHDFIDRLQLEVINLHKVLEKSYFLPRLET